MDNTQKPRSPLTFDPMSPPTPPPASPPASQRGELGGPPPTFPQEPPPITPPAAPPPFPTTPPWPPAPEPAPAPPPASATFTSPLDNPWGAPPQPPPINTPPTPPPWTPPASPDASLGGPQAPVEKDTAPTDLSHLVGNSSIPQPETLVVPPVSPEVPTYPAETTKRGVPKWLVGLGVGLLLAVVGASAYFIMGIGQAPKGGSVPAVPTQTTQQVKPPAPLPTPVTETETSSFGELQGGGQQATSAGDLLRQGQQQGR